MSSNTRTCLVFFGVIALIVGGIVAFFVNHHKVDYENYLKGHAAYQQLDCAGAIPYFEKALTTLKFFDDDIRSEAGPENRECVELLKGVDKQKAKDFSGALIDYDSFVTTYAASPLVEVAHNEVETIFRENEPATFVNEDLCNQIDQIASNDLVPQRDTNLPLIYFACGQLYDKAELYSFAIDYYDQFLDGYPNHPSTPEVKSALLHAIVANAKANGGDNLPTPERSGTTDDGSTVVIVRNESPESLRIVFSGSENRIEELEACSTCSTYYASPLFCPDTGPVERYTVQPGQYFVVVESTSDIGTTPWSGGWTLESGGEYTNCFFIAKR